MIEVFHIDDDREYATSLRSYAFENGISITHAANFEEMKDLFPEVSNIISTVIIDIKGKYKENDEFDDEGVLSFIIKYLDVNYPEIPRVILTGDKEGYGYIERYRKNERVFFKGNKEEVEMFECIKIISENLEEYKLCVKYKEIFEVFDEELLPKKRKGELIEILKAKDSIDNVTIKNSLARIRDIQEEIMLQVHKQKPTFLPKEKSHNPRGEISLTKCHNFLRYKSEYPHYISLPTFATYKLACEYGVHTSGSVMENNFIDKYIVKQSMYSLLNLIKWYKSIVR